MSETEKKEGLKTEICVSEENENLSSLCDRRCRVCNSDFVAEIHSMKKAGQELSEICSSLKLEKDFDISTASLSRHFKKYRERQQLMAAQILEGDLIEGATKQAAHTKEIVSLIDIAIDQLKKSAVAGSLHFDVSDLDKLMKMRYQILTGEMDEDTDILKILQKAKVIFNQNQLRIFDAH